MLNDRDHTQRNIIFAMEEMGMDTTDALRSYFAESHLKIDRFKVLTPEQEEAFQRWLTLDADIARAAAAKGFL